MSDKFLKAYSRYKIRKFKRAAQHVPPGKLLFFGDSITEFCPLKKYYGEYEPFNSGISGNTTQDLLDRMEVSVYAYQPAALVLLIGVNDIINEGRNADEVAGNYRQILQELKEHGVDRILAQSCYPTFGEYAYANQEIVLLNEKIMCLAEEYGCMYVDVHAALKDPHSGELQAGYSRDGLHPNEAGYAAVSEVLHGPLAELCRNCCPQDL